MTDKWPPQKFFPGDVVCALKGADHDTPYYVQKGKLYIVDSWVPVNQGFVNVVGLKGSYYCDVFRLANELELLETEYNNSIKGVGTKGGLSHV